MPATARISASRTTALKLRIYRTAALVTTEFNGGRGASAGTFAWMNGTRITGYFGWEVLTVSSIGLSARAWKFVGKLKFKVKSLPGCVSVVWTVTPSAFTIGSLSVTA